MSTETKREDFTGNHRILRYASPDTARIMNVTVRKTQAIWMIVFLICCCLTGCRTENPVPQTMDLEHAEHVFSYAENQPEGYPTTEAAHYFADLVRERSNGRILIDTASDGRLGDEDSVIRQLSYGGIDFARVSIAAVTTKVPDLKLLMLPYLYEDETHMWTVLDGAIGDAFLKDFEGSGIRALSWYDAGARSFYSTTVPIRTPEDMTGLNIRVQNSDIMKDLVRALGAEPVEAVYSDVRELLELQEIDGAENNLASYMAENHYLQARYYTMDHHSRIPEVQIISEATWNILSAEDRELITQCARESALYERGLWKAYEEQALNTVTSAGCEIIELTREERKAFQEKTADIYHVYFSDQQELIRKIQTAQ